MVSLNPFTADLISETAHNEARNCLGKDTDATSQLRKFYDELVMWHTNVFSVPDETAQTARYERCAPYIQMLRAKAAYAEGRGLVSMSFLTMFDSVIAGIKSKEDLKHAKLFMEAFMGFLKFERVAKGVEKR